MGIFLKLYSWVVLSDVIFPMVAVWSKLAHVRVCRCIEDVRVVGVGRCSVEECRADPKEHAEEAW